MVNSEWLFMQLDDKDHDKHDKKIEKLQDTLLSGMNRSERIELIFWLLTKLDEDLI